MEKMRFLELIGVFLIGIAIGIQYVVSSCMWRTDYGIFGKTEVYLSELIGELYTSTIASFFLIGLMLFFGGILITGKESK